MAGRFHEAVAQMVLDVANHMQRETGLQTVVLGGGVFQNMKLLSVTRRKLQEADLSVYIPQKLPANDGGIAPGQALIAATRLTQE
jgi:hydrogenase maturation protein HypF